MKVTKKVWVIMDKNHKAIACGVPRNRSMRMLGVALNTRILTYGSKGKAEAGFKVSGFYDETERETEEDGTVRTYLDKWYGTPKTRYNSFMKKDYKYYEWDYKDICEAVEAEITLEV